MKFEMTSRYEHELDKNHMKQLLTPYVPKVIVELGSHSGSDTRDFLSFMGRDDKIICVEADPRSILKHQNNIQDRRCKLIKAAVTDHDGQGLFHLSTAASPDFPEYGVWDASSSLKPPKRLLEVNPWVRYERDIIVKYMTLNTLYQRENLDIVDFLWVDVEGSFAEVVTGGSEALARTRFVYAEVENDEQYEGQTLYPTVLKMMQARNYELVFRFRHDALFRNLSLTESIEVI